MECGDCILLGLARVEKPGAAAEARVVEDHRSDSACGQKLLHDEPVLDGLSNAVTEKQVCSHIFFIGRYEHCVDEVATAGNGMTEDADRCFYRLRGCDSTEKPVAQNENAADESDADGEYPMLRVHHDNIPLARESIRRSAIGYAVECTPVLTLQLLRLGSQPLKFRGPEPWWLQAA